MRVSVGIKAVVNDSGQEESEGGGASRGGAGFSSINPARAVSLPLSVIDEADPRVQLLKELVDQAGVFLYDVMLPPGRSGVVQVMIASAAAGPSEVGHDQCNRLARLILDNERVEELLPGSVTLEVSSPGVNRELRSLAHLQGAVGERVRVVVRDYRLPDEAPVDREEKQGESPSSRAGVIRGILRAVGTEAVRMVDESRQVEVVIALADLKEARIDFVFDDIEEYSTPPVKG